jgi:predicted nucleic acid-binding protein
LRFLLDTNVLSEVRKPRPHGGVLAWMMARSESALAIPSIAIFELQMGIEQLRLQDAARARAFDAWIAQLMAGTTVLTLDAQAARRTALLMDKKPMELLADAMIAAIASVNGYTVATRNVKDFRHFDVPLVNPFDHKG